MTVVTGDLVRVELGVASGPCAGRTAIIVGLPQMPVQLLWVVCNGCLTVLHRSLIVGTNTSTQ